MPNKSSGLSLRMTYQQRGALISAVCDRLERLHSQKKIFYEDRRGEHGLITALEPLTFIGKNLVDDALRLMRMRSGFDLTTEGDLKELIEKGRILAAEIEEICAQASLKLVSKPIVDDTRIRHHRRHSLRPHAMAHSHGPDRRGRS